jgi:PAS domain S-box-containing protein
MAETRVEIVTSKNKLYHTLGVLDASNTSSAQERQHELDEKFNVIFHQSLDGILIIDQENGRIIDINPAIGRILGYNNGALVGQHFSALFPPHSSNHHTLSEKLALGGEILRAQEFCRADGCTQVMDLTTSKIPWEQGQAILAILHDATERVRAEEEIRQRNRELTLLNRVISAATSTLDVEQVLHFVCQELAQTFDLPHSVTALLDATQTTATVVAESHEPEQPDLVGRTIAIPDNSLGKSLIKEKTCVAIPDAHQDSRIAFLHDLMREHNTVSVLFVPIVVRDQVTGIIELGATERRLFTSKEIALAQNVAAAAGQVLETARLYQALRQHADRLQETVAQRTVELQVALVQAQDADRIKSQFVSNVSHELRTPLNNLKLYLALLTRGYEEKRQHYLDTIKREVNRLQSTIESLLDLSRLDLGQLKVEAEATDLNPLVHTLALDRQALAENRNLTLDVDLDESLPPSLADPKLIERVLANLLTNALNYTPEGGQVCITTRPQQAEDRSWVTVSVTDTGPGIADKERLRLFERFYRGQAGLDSDAPGTGLGLAISKEIVDQHAGHITVESEIGRGSTFTVWLPSATD